MKETSRKSDKVGSCFLDFMTCVPKAQSNQQKGILKDVKNLFQGSWPTSHHSELCEGAMLGKMCRARSSLVGFVLYGSCFEAVQVAEASLPGITAVVGAAAAASLAQLKRTTAGVTTVRQVRG